MKFKNIIETLDIIKSLNEISKKCVKAKELLNLEINFENLKTIEKFVYSYQRNR